MINIDNYVSIKVDIASFHYELQLHRSTSNLQLWTFEHPNDSKQLGHNNKAKRLCGETNVNDN